MFDENVRVGIDIVDGDHARLMETLEKIDAAMARGHRRAVERLLRSFLSDFERHFETESRLLRDLGCGNLDRRHSEFITARSTMAAHPIDARDPEQAARIVEFARAWLADHIVRQDGAVAAEIADRSKRTGFFRLRLVDRIPLRWRMAIMGVVPLVMLLGLAGLSAASLLESLHAADTMRAVVEIDTRIADLVYALQQESNEAIMVVGAPRRDRAALRQQIPITDTAITGFRRAAEPMRALHDHGVDEALDNAFSSLALIGRSRSDVQIGSYDVYSTIEYYETGVSDLMEILPAATRKLVPTEIARKIDAWLFLIRARERAGAERAQGTSLRSGVMVNVLARDPRRLEQIATVQDSLGRTFESLAGRPHSDAFASAAVVTPMLAAMRRAIVEGETGGPTALDWSETTGHRIDRMRAVEQSLVAAIETEVAEFSAQAWRHVSVVGGGIALAIALSLGLIARIGWSVVPPLGRLGAALGRLAEGERMVALPESGGRDEIAELARGFARLRDRLVQSDLTEAERGTANADRLRITLDGLPGVVFRIAQPGGTPPRVVAASSKLRDLTGLRDQDVLDRPLGSVIRACLEPQDRVSLLHILRRIGRGSLDFECRLRRRRDGRTRWMRILATPVVTGNGLIWDGVALDVTHAKEAEYERARLREELDRLYRAQTASRIAGGLGNDLAPLSRPLVERTRELVERLPEGSPLRAEIEEIHAAALRLDRVSERLNGLDEGGRVPAPVDVVDRLARRLAVSESGAARGPTLETGLEARGTPVFADPRSVDLMVDNLVVYVEETLGTEPGTVSVTTDVETVDGGRRFLRIAVRDDRSAFATHTLAKVLRTPSSRLPGGRGEELSLAIVRMIVDGMRGWVQSGRASGEPNALEIFLPVWEGRSDNVIRLERTASWSSRDH